MYRGPFQIGAQVLYVPAHAMEDVSHPDCERGFVTSVPHDTDDGERLVFARYYHKDRDEIRTTSCSELTNVDDLILYMHHTDEEIRQQLRRFGYEE